MLMMPIARDADTLPLLIRHYFRRVSPLMPFDDTPLEAIFIAISCFR